MGQVALQLGMCVTMLDPGRSHVEHIMHQPTYADGPRLAFDESKRLFPQLDVEIVTK